MSVRANGPDDLGGKVLVVGHVAQTTRRVVEELLALDLDVTSCTDPAHAASAHDANDFDLIAFGRGTLGPVSDQQKQAFRAQKPGIRFVDAIAPLAIRQILAALRQGHSAPRFLESVDVEPVGDRGVVRTEVLADCQMKLTLFRRASGALTAESLALVEAVAGVFTFTIDAERMVGAYSLIIDANGEELVHFPFLQAPARG